MQAIHNDDVVARQRAICCFKEQRYKINASNSQLMLLLIRLKLMLFQRAKIQDKCKQFTTHLTVLPLMIVLFQRAKIQDKCKQFTTISYFIGERNVLFQRAKIQDKCKQFTFIPFS